MATDMFLKIDGIPGGSTDKAHPGEIEVLSYSWGVKNSGTGGFGGGGGEGKASFHDLTFVSHQDKSSPVLMRSCATGVHIKEATITVRKAGANNSDFYKIRLTDVLVSSVDETGVEDSRDVTPNDQVSLNFQKVHVEFVSPT